MRAAASRMRGRENLVGAEVGVEWGEHAREMINGLSIDLLYLVDPYIVSWLHCFPLSNIPMTVEESMRQYQAACKRLEPHRGFREGWKIKWIHKFSWQIDEFEIPNESLDFAYLDADHVYQAVKMDLTVWWPKIKPGGMLSGHDFDFPSVRKAVEEFIREKEGEISEHGNDGKNVKSDWWAFKK